MAEKSEFWEQYKDPRWQKKRLEIMERDRWKCVVCGEDGDTLNVHHGYYRKGAAPWDYEDETLHTLCELCHESAEQLLLEIRRTLAAQVMPLAILGYLRAYNAYFDGETGFFVHKNCLPMVRGAADFFRLSPNQLAFCADSQGRIYLDDLEFADYPHEDKEAEASCVEDPWQVLEVG